MYAPAVLEPGVKMPLCGVPPGAVQVPLSCGVPPNLVISAKGGWLEQVVKVALNPAFGGALTATDTVAVAVAQGGTPVTV
jgi:hypothetical protein